MKEKPSIPQGTRDFLPEVMLRRELIFDTIRRVFRKYGYAPIETPTMEKLSVLTGKYGEEGDRLIFKVLNSGNFLEGVSLSDDVRALTPRIAEKALRYDLTVPFARFVVMHHHELTFPFRRYQIQPVWRADRPQKGRYREFYQCDADVVGSDSLLLEAEFIAMYDEALSGLGIPSFSVMINHRQILSGFAELAGAPDQVTEICMAIDKLDKIGEDGVRKELAERGLTAEAADRIFALLAVSGDTAAKLAFLETQFADSPAGLTGVRELREMLVHYQHLPRWNAQVELSLTLARGLNYYTGAIFEVKAHGVSIGSIGGGGRYADLTGVFGMPDLPGVGISFGADRIYDVMEALGLFTAEATSQTRALIIHFGPEYLAHTLPLSASLRQAGIATELFPEPAKLKKQFAYADKKGIPYTLIVGETEAAAGMCQIKNMTTGTQVTLPLTAVADWFLQQHV